MELVVQVLTGRLAATLLALCVLPGCTADAVEPSEADSPTLRAPATVPGEPAETAERAALEAYRGMWVAFDQAGRTANGEPEAALEAYATGNALQRLLDGLQSFREDGLITNGELALNPEVTRLEPSGAPTSAEVEDCGDSTDWHLVRADGEPYEDEPGGFRQIFAELELGDDGAWRVVDFAVLEVGTCSARAEESP